MTKLKRKVWKNEFYCLYAANGEVLATFTSTYDAKRQGIHTERLPLYEFSELLRWEANGIVPQFNTPYVVHFSATDLNEEEEKEI